MGPEEEEEQLLLIFSDFGWSSVAANVVAFLRGLPGPLLVP